jgi:phosphoribosylaminoimidazolecarboxamide formyltransferase/IMP cyclohydrolase
MAKQAIIHVENTQNIIEFAEFLHKTGWEILSANKTEELLQKNKIPVTHEAALEENNLYVQETSNLVRRVLMSRIDADEDYGHAVHDNSIYIVCANIFPFLDINIDKKGKQPQTEIKPFTLYISTLLRNSFTNHENLLILTDPADYKEAIVQLKTDNVSSDFRLYLAAKALNLISAFDGGIAASILQSEKFKIKFLNYISFPFKKEVNLQLGTNPQQKASLYRTPVDFGALNGFSKLTGKDISYTMAADSTFAWDQIHSLYSLFKNQYNVKSENKDGYPFTTQFTPLTGTVFSIVIKMLNILGAGVSSNVLESFHRAYSYDTQNIKDATFGCSAVIDANAAREIANCDFSVIIAPGFTPEAKDILSEKKHTKLITAGKANKIGLDGKLINGGIILQELDDTPFNHWKITTKNRPSQVIADEMAFGMRMVMSARSYSAILIKGNSIVGIAQSCLSNIEALERVLSDALCRKARSAQEGQADEPLADVLVCDTAIPFCEHITKLTDAGVSAIIQPGGTASDSDFINYCDERNLVMVFTDMTHINF